MAQTRRRLKTEKIIPAAARTVASLRDIGYDAPRAIADLVDNSVAAGATEVDITLKFDGSDSWIRVADNGAGMDGATLLEAMRYGSQREYEDDDLGKFGFGLKTASTSQCLKLTVAARRSQQSARLEVRCLDLTHIQETNKWEVLVLDGSDRPVQVTELLAKHPGTVVLWQDLDRILEYKDPWGEWARKKLLALAEEVDNHLAMVFHRFLGGEVRGHKLAIRVNGNRVEAWDPFCRAEKVEDIPAKDLAAGVRPCQLEQAAGLLHLSRQSADPVRRLEPDAHDRRAHEARTRCARLLSRPGRGLRHQHRQGVRQPAAGPARAARVRGVGGGPTSRPAVPVGRGPRAHQQCWWWRFDLPRRKGLPGEHTGCWRSGPQR